MADSHDMQNRSLVPVRGEPATAMSVPGTSYLPGGALASDDDQGLGKLKDVLAALRRKGLWILLLGAVFSSAAGVSAWYLVPTPFTAYSELLYQPKKFFWETNEEQARSDVKKQTLMRMVKDPYVITAALRDPEVTNCQTIRNLQFPIEWLSAELTVNSPAEQFIRVSLSGEHPGDLAKIVNAITTAFDQEVLLKEQEERRTALQELKTVLQREDDKLSAKQDALRRIDRELAVSNREQSNLKQQSLLDAQNLTRQELARIQQRLLEAQIILGETGGDVVEAPQVDESATEEILQGIMLQDADYRRLASKAAYEEMMVQEWAKRVRSDHPSIKEHEDRLVVAVQAADNRRKEIEPAAREKLKAEIFRQASGQAGLKGPEELRREISLLQALKKGYEADLEKTKTEERDLGVAWVEREVLEEQVNELKAMTKHYQEEVMRRQVELDNAPPPVKIRLRAEVPRVPDTGKRMKTTAMASMGVFGLIALLFVAWEMAANRVTRLEQISRGMRLPVISAIPRVPRSVRAGGKKLRSSSALYWQSVFQETHDAMRTLLLHNPRLGNPRVIMVTSAMVAEGKSTTSCQLAASFARSKRRVILIDMDLRRPSVHHGFRVPSSPGFCELMCGDVRLEEVIHPSGLPGLDILPAGRVTQEALERLAQDEHGPILKEIAANYDYVIIDTSPLLPVTDGLLVARHVDGTLFVVQRDVSRVGKVTTAVQRLTSMGTPLLGVVAIGLADQAHSAYGYGYGSYNYGTPVKDHGETPKNAKVRHSEVAIM